MSEAPLHPEEESRLNALLALEVLDTAEESVFDEVVKMAANVCGVPIGLISLIDEHRQWFKAKHGLDAVETPRCDAFCSHAILESGTPLVVKDATKDDRFFDNPLVTSGPGIRFYAGVPLSVEEGLPLGTLCVIGDKPMDLPDDKLAILKMFARHVEGMLKVRRSTLQLRKAHRMMERTQATLDSSADGVAWVSPQGEFRYVNQQFCKQLGYTAEQFHEMTVLDVNPDLASIESFKTDIWPNIVANKKMTFEMRHKHCDGTIFPVEISSHLMEFDDETIGCSFIRDITDRKETESKLKTYSEDLERANSELQQFATIASHDLKQPLRGISHLAQWAIEDGGEAMPEASKEHLHKLQARVVRLGQLLDDLLEYSRAGADAGADEEIDVRVLVDQVIELSDAPIGFKFAFQGEFPKLVTQRVPLSIVFRNLIGNAVKYRLKDDGTITITAGKNSSGEQQFIVSDDGRGIAPKFHQYVFGMFSKLNSADEIESSGMGLAMIKKLIDARGGIIELESAEGEGATFTFTWPVKRSR